MLQNGAVKVFAIDVGRGQLDWKLRQDPRVVCMEKTNIRYVTPEDIGEPVDFSSIDVSFISLTKVLEPIRDYLTEDGEIVALIKPQFEAGREKVGKKGVVREKSTHHEVIEKVTSYAASIGFDILGASEEDAGTSGKDPGTESGDGRGQCIRYVGKISGDKAWIHFIS